MYSNKVRLRSLSKGSPPRKRIEVQEDQQVFGYSGQKLNIYEM